MGATSSTNLFCSPGLLLKPCVLSCEASGACLKNSLTLGLCYLLIPERGL